MKLYHGTMIKFLPSIREQGLLPHVPGVIWQDGDPDIAKMTDGKPVVWLTLDRNEWHHDAHPTNPRLDARLLTVRLEPNRKRLVRYLPWLRSNVPAIYERLRKNGFQGQSVGAWHVYFGTIPPASIVDGLHDSAKAIAA